MLFLMSTKSQPRSSKGQILLFLIILLVPGGVRFVSAADVDGTIAEGEYANQVSLSEGNFLLYWEVSGDSVYFGIKAPTEGWVSLGIEPTQAMAEADMIFGWVEPGEAAGALDCYSTGMFGPHPPDEELGGEQNILSFAAEQTDGLTSFEFARLLDTGDAYDKALPVQGEVKIIWASSNSDNYLDPHTRRGSAVISLAGAQEPQTEGGGGLDLYSLLYWVHGSFMSASFLLLFVGMFFPRYLKRKKWWLKTHRRMGIAGTVIGVVGIAIAVYMISRTTQMHLRVLHSWIGLVTIILMVFSPFLGHFMLKIRKDPGRAKRARAVHRWIGRITLLFMAVTIALGLQQAGIL
jgi:hypothetical protein